MRIASQTSTDFSTQQNVSPKVAAKPKAIETSNDINRVPSVEALFNTANATQESTTDKEALKEKLLPAIDTMNELLETTQKSSKFILHEGLDKYYVRLVDAKTEEVIKEIPPQRLLDAFYEMQKMAGMIVDEKI